MQHRTTCSENMSPSLSVCPVTLFPVYTGWSFPLTMKVGLSNHDPVPRTDDGMLSFASDTGMVLCHEYHDRASRYIGIRLPCLQPGAYSTIGLQLLNSQSEFALLIIYEVEINPGRQENVCTLSKHGVVSFLTFSLLLLAVNTRIRCSL